MTSPLAEETLRLSEERWRALTTAIADIVWITDARGQVIEDQPGWRAFTGQTREEIDGAGWLAALHPDSRAETISAWAGAVARGLPYETEWNLRRRDGQYRCFSIRAAPVRSLNGAVREWIGSNIDITDQQQRNEALMRLHDQADAAAAQLKRQAREMQILKNLGETLQACNSREEAYPFIALAATELFPGGSGALAVPAADVPGLLETVSEWGGQGGQGGWMQPDFAVDDCWALRRGAMHEPGAGTACHHLKTDPAGSYVCLPLSVRGQVAGLLSVHVPAPEGLDDQRRESLSNFGNALALGLSTLQLRESLQIQQSPS